MNLNQLKIKSIFKGCFLFAVMSCSAFIYAAQDLTNEKHSSLQRSSSTIILKKLDYKTVFIQFHQKEIHFLKMKSIEMDEAVGLKSTDGEVKYAVFNPVQNYRNVNGEKRFIVHIEIFDQDDGEIRTGHPSRPKVELYLFKQLANGQYQLLSQTRPDVDISGSWGESHLNAGDFKEIQRVGADQMGLIYSGGYTSTGSHTETEFLIVFNEQGWIEQYPFGVSESNIGAHDEDDPEFGQYAKQYKILNDSHSEGLYPIRIDYSQQGKMDWNEGFPKNGTQEIIKFNSKKNCYVHANGQCNSDFDDEE